MKYLFTKASFISDGSATTSHIATTDPLFERLLADQNERLYRMWKVYAKEDGRRTTVDIFYNL